MLRATLGYDDCRPKLIADGDLGAISQNEYVRDSIESWKPEAQRVAMSGHHLVLQDGMEIADSESSSQEHGEELTGMYAPGCESLDRKDRRPPLVGPSK
jgi:hypothetical protein